MNDDKRIGLKKTWERSHCAIGLRSRQARFHGIKTQIRIEQEQTETEGVSEFGQFSVISVTSCSFPIGAK